MLDILPPLIMAVGILLLDDDDDDGILLLALAVILLEEANQRETRACSKRKRISPGSEIDSDSDLDLLDDSSDSSDADSSDDDSSDADSSDDDSSNDDSSHDESLLVRPSKRTRRQLGQELMQEDQDQE